MEAESVSLHITALGGNAVDLEAAHDCPIGELKLLIATRLGFVRGRHIRLFSGERAIVDSELASQVSDLPLQAVLDTIVVAEMIGPELEGSDKFQAGGILASNGCIYYAPYDARRVLCVNPEAGTVEMIGPSSRALQNSRPAASSLPRGASTLPRTTPARCCA